VLQLQTLCPWGQPNPTAVVQFRDIALSSGCVPWAVIRVCWPRCDHKIWLDYLCNHTLDRVRSTIQDELRARNEGQAFKTNITLIGNVTPLSAAQTACTILGNLKIAVAIYTVRVLQRQSTKRTILRYAANLSIRHISCRIMSRDKQETIKTLQFLVSYRKVHGPHVYEMRRTSSNDTFLTLGKILPIKLVQVDILSKDRGIDSMTYERV
jgi:hypothetical protein